MLTFSNFFFSQRPVNMLLKHNKNWLLILYTLEIKSNKNTFRGQTIRNIFQCSDWVWSDGTPVDYTPWMDNRILNLNANEHCVVFRQSDGSFDDWSCSNLLPFICKMPKGFS